MTTLDTRITKLESPFKDDRRAVCVFVDHPPSEEQLQAIEDAKNEGRRVIWLTWMQSDD
jgi:hypothetical protein